MIRSLGLVMVLATANLLLSCAHKNNTSLESTVSDKLALPEAKELMNRITSQAKKGVMLGHQDALAYGIGWKEDVFRTDINDASGDYPAVFGWDLGHIADTVNIDSVSFSKMTQWATEVYRRGGINTYSWHERNIATGGNSWDITPAIDQLLPGGQKHEAFCQILDLLADFFNSLKTPEGKPMPVVFRPFHEMNGGWFWWGIKSCSAEQYQALYQFTVNYLRNEKNLHQLLYVYSPDVFSSREDYLTWYPGDAYVDILGVDDYKNLHSPAGFEQARQQIGILQELSKEKSKPFIISETGYETLSDSLWFTKTLLPAITSDSTPTGIAWVLLWRNGRPDHFYAPYPGHACVNDFIQFKNHPQTLFLSDLD